MIQKAAVPTLKELGYEEKDRFGLFWILIAPVEELLLDAIK
jgi:hypothetical protein